MPEYRRWKQPGGAYFFTVVTHERRPIFAAPATVALLRTAFANVRALHPFQIDAIVILPDHLHAIWTLPTNDLDFSTRWRLIKRRFTDAFLDSGGREGPRSASRVRQSERGVWQRRFWERAIRDEEEMEAYANYIHYNPVKHGHAACPHAWPYSSFDRCVRRGLYDPDWACTCPRPGAAAPRPIRIESPAHTGE